MVGPKWVTSPPASQAVIDAITDRWPRRLPAGYLQFLRVTDGASAGIYEIWPAEKTVMDPYNAAEFGPHLVIFGCDGCGELFAFDTSQEPPPPVVMVDAISDWREDAIVVARDFGSFLRRLEQAASGQGYSLFDADRSAP